MDELVPMTLDGEYIEVNQASLQEHKNLGWRECEKQEQESNKRLSIAEIRDVLTEKGVSFDLSAKKTELQSLLDQNNEAAE